MSKKHKTSRYKQGVRWIKNLSTRTKMIAMIGLLFVIIIALLAYLVAATNQKHDSLPDSSDASHEAALRRVQHDVALNDSADQAIAEGNNQKVTEIYENAIAAEPDASRKVQLYINHSRLLYNVGKYAQAIAIAQEGEKVSDDKFLIADWMARLYEDQRQYTKAADYYNLAAKWATSKTNMTGLNSDFYKNQAKRVLTLAGKS